jgi:fructokinase
LAETNVVVGIGEVLWDIYQNEKHLGGAPANFAIHAQQLGNQGIVVSRVGDDGMGQELINTLQNRGIATDYIQIDRKNGTGTVIVSLDIKGVPSFRCSENVAFDFLEYDKKLAGLATTCDAVLFGTLAQRNRVARRSIRRFLLAAEKAVKVFDPNLRSWDASTRQIIKECLPLADILKLNGEEADRLRDILPGSGRTRADYLSYLFETYGLQLLAITYGEEGCELHRPGERVRVPGIRVEPIDTTGCGDAFAAGLVTRYLQGGSLREIAEFANCVGAFNATRWGATPVYSLEELEQFVRQHPVEGGEESSR